MHGAALARVMRHDRGRLLAALIARTGDFQRAEDALHEAAAAALVQWDRAGVPDNPTAWLLRTAWRKAIDSHRRDATLARHRAALADLPAGEDAPEAEAIPDDRLRLIFTCCHPALEEKSRIALTLRSLCGLTTAEIAAVFLDTEASMGQRLSRAKAKIAAARIPYAVPEPEDWPDRLNSVLTTIYLIFTAGYTQGARADLCDEAVFLGRLMVGLAPDHAEAEGCLALMLLTHARAPARVSASGATLPPSQQDRSLWNRAMLAEGQELLDHAMARRAPGPFQIKAAIAALNAEAPLDWPQIAGLYARLLAHEPTPVVRLNHAVALAEAGHLAAALDRLQPLSALLSDYQPYHAARAELLARARRIPEALSAYDTALRLAASPADRAFLAARRAALEKKGRA
jgi:RNA polymerase sigma-70 factor (ECF subfamily)